MKIMRQLRDSYKRDALNYGLNGPYERSVEGTTAIITKTLIVVLLAESDSMNSKKFHVMRGYNDFLHVQRFVCTDEARLTLIKFNDRCTVAHEPECLKDVPNLSHKNYMPSGATAIFDAIAEGVRIADKSKETDERVLCLIITDGDENASRETTGQQVKDIIESRESCGDWTFAYIGEQPEKWTSELGMHGANATVFDQSNPFGNFVLASDATKYYRMANKKKSERFFVLKK